MYGREYRFFDWANTGVSVSALNVHLYIFPWKIIIGEISLEELFGNYLNRRKQRETYGNFTTDERVVEHVVSSSRISAGSTTVYFI